MYGQAATEFAVPHRQFNSFTNDLPLSETLQIASVMLVYNILIVAAHSIS